MTQQAPSSPESSPESSQESPLDFLGRVALVTGGSSGIGRETARLLASRGAAVAITGRRKDALEATAADLRNRGARVLVVVGDVRDAAHPAEAVKRTVEGLGALTLLVNNAGVIGAGPLESTTDEEWERLFDVDLTAPFRFARAAIPHLKGKPGAAIVNVSSVTGRRPYANIGPYCTVKAGLDMLTECLALELAPHGVRVNAVNPGVVVTELHTASKAVADYGAFLARSRETHPIGFVGEPRDVAEMIAFLASDRARWITGGLFPVDGGRALTSLR